MGQFLRDKKVVGVFVRFRATSSKFNLVKAQQYILMSTWGSNNGSIENPCWHGCLFDQNKALFIWYRLNSDK
jgi:hypothetical protein